MMPRLQKTCEEMVEGLLANKIRHVLCLNIASPDFQAEKVVLAYLDGKKKTNVVTKHEPSEKEFSELLDGIAGKIVVVHYEDFDKHPKSNDLLGEHVKKPDPGGKLIIVSRHWNSDNSEKEKELRRFCLFYQQNFARPK
jgi:hypothetical protein